MVERCRKWADRKETSWHFLAFCVTCWIQTSWAGHTRWSCSICFNLFQSCSIMFHPFPKAVKGGRSRICFVSQSLDPKRQPSMWKMSGSTCQALALGTEQEASQGESNKTARMPWELHHLTLQTVASSTLLGDIRGSYYRISLTSIWWLQKRRKASRECLVFF